MSTHPGRADVVPRLLVTYGGTGMHNPDCQVWAGQVEVECGHGLSCKLTAWLNLIAMLCCCVFANSTVGCKAETSRTLGRER